MREAAVNRALSRIGLTPRLALIIVLALWAAEMLDSLLVSLVPPPRTLFYTRDWLAEQTALASAVAESSPASTREQSVQALSSDWLVFEVSRSAPTPEHGALPLDDVHRVILEHLPDRDRRRVLAYATPMEDAERQTSAISIVLPGVPALIHNILDDEFREPAIAAGKLFVAVELSDGAWLRLSEPQRGSSAARELRNAFVYFGGFALIVVFAVLAARMVVRPLRQLASAADRLGRQREVADVPRAYVPEIDAIADSFNEMQRRLKRFIDERTLMLAAISHDLRTPLTRLRLFVEFLDDPQQRRSVLQDIHEMEQMISTSLIFSSGEVQHEPSSNVDLSALLISLCDLRADAGQAAHFDGPDHAELPCRPVALRRAFSNLIDNAIKYGGSALVTLRDRPDAIEVTIEDAGPGIPPEQSEQAFVPFRRLETSRNRESGGVGLGLTIARDVIHAHGGSIQLEPNQPCGLRARVRLPKPGSTPDRRSSASSAGERS
jgi:signal transduction histidine kinase